MAKKKPIGARNLKARAKDAGLNMTSVGVNIAALVGSSVKEVPVNLAALAASSTWTNPPTTGITETEWQGQVKSFAEAHGWTCYHTLNSKGSDSGFRDLTMAKECINTGDIWMYIAELKTETGEETKEQKKWGYFFTQLATAIPRGSGCRLRNYLWRPSHWEMVKTILSEPME